MYIVIIDVTDIVNVVLQAYKQLIHQLQQDNNTSYNIEVPIEFFDPNPNRQNSTNGPKK